LVRIDFFCIDSIRFCIDFIHLITSMDECYHSSISNKYSVYLIDIEYEYYFLYYRKDKEIIEPRSTTFSWFLYLDFMLIVNRR
jgi:hypothetical protein